MRRCTIAFLLAALLCCACSDTRAGARPPRPEPTAGPPAALVAVSRRLNDTPILEDAGAPPRSVSLADAAPEAAPSAAAPAPDRAARAPVRIVIPDIDMDQPLEAVGLDDQGLPVVPKHAAAWYSDSAVPGQGDNVVLWGHALRFKREPNIPAPFGRLKDLSPGGQVLLYDAAGTAYSYVITRQVWATPDQVKYILPQGREQITMVSCIGDKVVRPTGVDMTHRLITIAEPQH
jgi:sortase (surface protein transpeptidase)